MISILLFFFCCIYIYLLSQYGWPFVHVDTSIDSIIIYNNTVCTPMYTLYWMNIICSCSFKLLLDADDEVHSSTRFCSHFLCLSKIYHSVCVDVCTYEPMSDDMAVENAGGADADWGQGNEIVFSYFLNLTRELGMLLLIAALTRSIYSVPFRVLPISSSPSNRWQSKEVDKWLIRFTTCPTYSIHSIWGMTYDTWLFSCSCLFLHRNIANGDYTLHINHSMINSDNVNSIYYNI